MSEEPARKRRKGDAGDVGGGVDDDKTDLQQHAVTSSSSTSRALTAVNEKGKTEYLFGNYPQYYTNRYKQVFGKQNRVTQARFDPRLSVMRMPWFKDKRVLDIGCNSGQLTLALAQKFQCATVLGVDVDAGLIEAALRNQEQCDMHTRALSSTVAEGSDARVFDYFPQAALGKERVCDRHMQLYLEQHHHKHRKNNYPYNVSFRCADFARCDDTVLHVNDQGGTFDVILALSVTKWVHLHEGDEGMKRFFRRVYEHLSEDGKFIMEAQPFSSYRWKKTLTPEIEHVYQSIEFKPDQFAKYLVDEVGFLAYRELSYKERDIEALKGFKGRPLLLFNK